MKNLRFRQIHLDFHTAPQITGIGEKFDKKAWQERLREARVNSITCFSCCHHGYSYHPTQVGRMHPHLKFNLLRSQMDACKEIDINVPIYLTAGFSDLAAELHPEWRALDFQGRFMGGSPTPLTPGFRKLCFNSPYLDFLCDLISEAVTMFPEADGVFLDIIYQGQCCCDNCMRGMLADSLNPESEADRIAYGRKVLLNYYRRATEAVKSIAPEMPVFHNSGHVTIGDTDILKYFSHLELESLPTGGWGYDHYPMSAAYSRKLGMEFLGMTGKFHTTWGEFGGIKHPNALRYECAAMIANGSKCSVGDQLHPSGALDASTYAAIGAAYREVEAREAWCDNVSSAAEIAILAAAATIPGGARECPGDVGASRMLLESHLPFDIVDRRMDFSAYPVLLLPDGAMVDDELDAKINAYLASGGKLICAGATAFDGEGNPRFGLDLEHGGKSPFSPDYILAAPAVAPDFAHTPFVMYLPSERIRVRSGQSLGEIYDPWFNRTFEHFCSHQHAPFQNEPSGWQAGVATDRVLYFAHDIFTLYRAYGAVVEKEFVMNSIKQFLGNEIQVITSLPSQGRITWMRQADENRDVIHLLYANTILRGGQLQLSGGTLNSRGAVEVIEDLNDLFNVKLSLRIRRPVREVTLEPEGVSIDFITDESGRLNLTVPKLNCHQMVVLHY